jgi:hypothetical protein
MIYDIGDVVTLDFTDEVDGVPTDAGAVTVTVTKPDGSTVTPSVSHDDVGVYSAQYAPTLDGPYTYRWVATGTGQTAESGSFYVGAVVSVAEVRDRLNKDLTVDDGEIADMIVAAQAEYAEYVGPLPGSVTETLNGGGTTLVLRSPNPTAITSAVYSDGTTITTADLDPDSSTGIVYWKYGTTGRFTGGTRNVTVTYTVGDLPANHREAIIADVAGYFEMTQEGPAGPDDGYATGNRSTPLVLFPRIRSLAMPGVA